MGWREYVSASDKDLNVIVVCRYRNVVADLGLDDAERAIVALAEFHAKGGRRFEDFKAELDALPRLEHDS